MSTHCMDQQIIWPHSVIPLHGSITWSQCILSHNMDPLCDSIYHYMNLWRDSIPHLPFHYVVSLLHLVTWIYYVVPLVIPMCDLIMSFYCVNPLLISLRLPFIWSHYIILFRFSWCKVQGKRLKLENVLVATSFY